MLQEHDVGDNVNNFYAAKRTNKQRHNLQTYLQVVKEYSSGLMIVGEAPGYNGCAKTGIPFSSEQLLRQEMIQGKVFGKANGFHVSNNSVSNEQTASSMWQVLQSYEIIPLMWNAFPFHPHRKDDRRSNRKPTIKEISEGSIYLSMLMDLFEITRVIAVGNSAEEALKRAGIAHAKVRHPSYGGKVDFMNGMRQFLDEMA